MSEILKRLKHAEAERERVIAERKRLETEADAALAQRDREEFVAWQRVAERPLPPRVDVPAPRQGSRLAAGAAIAVALLVVFWIGTMMPRDSAPARAPEPVAAFPATAPAPVPAVRPAPVVFKLDRDAEAFARRAGERP